MISTFSAYFLIFLCLVMAIIQHLGKVCNVRTGNMNKEDGVSSGIYPFFTRSIEIERSNNYTIDFESVIIPGEGIFTPMWNSGKAAIHQRVYVLNSKDSRILHNKYLFYWWTKNKHILNRQSVGSTVKSLRKSNFENPMIKLPFIEEQQKIIDIIEPHEKLFLKYNNCVRIDTFENAENDINQLIDIIEPLENILNKTNELIFCIKKILALIYSINRNEYDKISAFCLINNQKWTNQKKYLATNAIREFECDLAKEQDISKKRPSRADLTPIKESLIISKLDGENKVFYINENFSWVISTGFLNLSSKYIDHLAGYFLSNEFKKMKTIFSSGTTMTGLTNSSFKLLEIKRPMISSSIFSTFLSRLIENKNYFEKIKDSIIRLLIK